LFLAYSLNLVFSSSALAVPPERLLDNNEKKSLKDLHRLSFKDFE